MSREGWRSGGGAKAGESLRSNASGRRISGWNLGGHWETSGILVIRGEGGKEWEEKQRKKERKTQSDEARVLGGYRVVLR